MILSLNMRLKSKLNHFWCLSLLAPKSIVACSCCVPEQVLSTLGFTHWRSPYPRVVGGVSWLLAPQNVSGVPVAGNTYLPNYTILPHVPVIWHNLCRAGHLTDFLLGAPSLPLWLESFTATDSLPDSGFSPCVKTSSLRDLGQIH